MEGGEDAEDYLFGCILGVALVVDCVPVELLTGPKSAIPERFRDLHGSADAIGPYCIIMEAAAEFRKVFAVTGRQRLWKPDADIMEEIVSQIPKGWPKPR